MQVISVWCCHGNMSSEDLYKGMNAEFTALYIST